MGFILLVAFIAVPLIEIALFIQVGEVIGLWPTIAVVVLTAFAGTALLRHQGLGALARLQESMDRGEPPIDPVFDGFCLLAAGMLLLTPGFFTDAVGFALFMPPLRKVLKAFIAARMQVHTAHPGMSGGGGAHFHYRAGGFPGGPFAGSNAAGTPGPDGVIDGEFEDVTDTKTKPALSDKPDRQG